jgi:2-polyprenyl-3-methyl-5-hydroxy-6-metoxy-1,4-benzoquinol methylase
MPDGVSRPPATEETQCNLCGASDYDVIARTDRDGRPLRTVLCRRCGLAWVNPRPPSAAMDAYYENEYRADYKGSHAPALRKILRGVIGAADRRRELRQLVGPGASVLDVGCGAGELVYLLREDGIDAAGIEPGREYAGFARGTLGLPVQTATVATATVAPGSLDLVTMFHSLEHVPDPRGVLATVHGWLRRGGRLVVEVPNFESTVQAPRHRYHYAHLYHFTGSTLAALGTTVGLTPVRTAYSEDGGNVVCVFRREDAQPRPVARLESAGRTREILRSHTAVRHYLGATPYRRAFRRLRQRRIEDRLLRRLRSIEAILEWAAGRSGDDGPVLAEASKSRLH